jgi:methionyl-tRNA formyltransferase
MRVLFIGSTKRGWGALQAIAQSTSQIVGIISLEQHPHEIERCENKFRKFADEKSIPLFECKNFKDRDYGSLIRNKLCPEIAVVVGARVLFPKEVLEAPRLGTFAVHDSLLPNYRGFAPLHWAILNGEKKTGVTLFKVTEEMDAGDIVGQIEIPIAPDDTATEIYEKSCVASASLLKEAVEEIEKTGRIPTRAQDPQQATYTCSRTPEDGWINWQASTDNIYNLIRALSYPFPGAFTLFKESTLTVWRAQPVNAARNYVGRIPGRVIHVAPEGPNEGFIDVLTGDGILRIFEVQRNGGEREPAANVVRSVRETLGRREGYGIR